jgi:hypothetical protein
VIRDAFNVRAQDVADPVRLVAIGNRRTWLGDDKGTGGNPDVAYWCNFNPAAAPFTGYGYVSDFFSNKPYSENDISNLSAYYVSLDLSVSCPVTYSDATREVVSGSHDLFLYRPTINVPSNAPIPASRYRTIGLYLRSDTAPFGFAQVQSNMRAVHEDYLVALPQVTSFNDPSRFWEDGSKTLGIFRPFSDVPTLQYMGTTNGFLYSERYRPILAGDRINCCMNRQSSDTICGSRSQLNYQAPQGPAWATNRCDRFMQSYCASNAYSDPLCGCLNPNSLPEAVRNTPAVNNSIVGASSEWQCFNTKCAATDTATYKPSQFLGRTCDITVCTLLQIAQGVNIVQTGNTQTLTCPGTGTSGGTSTTVSTSTSTRTGTGTGTSSSGGGGGVTGVGGLNQVVLNFLSIGSPDGSGSINYVVLIVTLVVLALLVSFVIASRRGRAAVDREFNEQLQGFDDDDGGGGGGMS